MSYKTCPIGTKDVNSLSEHTGSSMVLDLHAVEDGTAATTAAAGAGLDADPSCPAGPVTLLVRDESRSTKTTTGTTATTTSTTGGEGGGGERRKVVRHTRLATPARAMASSRSSLSLDFYNSDEEAGAGAKATLSSEESDASQQNEAKGIIDIKTFLK